MARLVTIGWEQTGFFGDTETTLVVSSPSLSSPQTGVKRTGSGAFKVDFVPPDNYGESQVNFSSTGANRPIYARTYFRIDQMGGTKSGYLFRLDGTAANSGQGLAFYSNDVIQTVIKDGLGEKQFVGLQYKLETGIWYRAEVYGRSDDITGYLETRLNGGRLFSGTVPKNNFAMAIAGSQNQLATFPTGYLIYYDDLAVNDEIGPFQNSWPEEGSVVMLVPTGVGDFAEGTSVPAATAGWVVTDDSRAPNRANDYWTFVTNSSANSSSPDRLDVRVNSATQADIPNNSLIKVVHACGAYQGASANSCSIVFRLKSRSNGTVLEGATQTITDATTWHVNEYTLKTAICTSYLDTQNTGNPWNISGINTMQVGARAPDANPDVRLTALWAYVEYVPPTDQTIIMLEETVGFE